MRKLSDKIKREKRRFCYVNDDGSFNTECYLQHFANEMWIKWRWLLGRANKWQINNIEKINVPAPEDIKVSFVEEKYIGLSYAVELTKVHKFIDGINHPEHCYTEWLSFEHIYYNDGSIYQDFGLCPTEWAGLVHEIDDSDVLRDDWKRLFLELVDKFGTDECNFLEVNYHAES